MKYFLASAYFVIVSSTLFGHVLIDNYIGNWQGKLIIYANGLLVDTSVQVEFIIEKIENTETYVWKKTYVANKGNNVIKDYKLVYNGDNRFQIDEGDGIVLDSYLFQNKIYSSFTMKKILIASIYTFNQNEIIFELISGKKQKKIKEGINNYNQNILQFIRFKKVE